ncbi:hypothetical protein OROHE_016235 [Orobanche hederae]
MSRPHTTAFFPSAGIETFTGDTSMKPPPPQQQRPFVMADLNVDPPETEAYAFSSPTSSVLISRMTIDETILEKVTCTGKEAEAMDVEASQWKKVGRCRSKNGKAEYPPDSGGADIDGNQNGQGVSASCREEKVSSLKTGLVHVAKKMPKNMHAHLILGLMYQRMGQPQKAILAYEKASEILLRSEEEIDRPELLSVVQLHHAQCILLESSENYSSDKELDPQELDEICSKLRESMELDVRQASVWNTLGLILLRTGRLQSAVSVFSSLLEIAPDNLDALGNLGIAYLQGGYLEHSEKCLQDLLLKDQNHPAALINYAALLLCRYGSVIADDIVLIEETKVGVQQKLELWRDTLEARGFRLSRSKTEYMECRFSDNSDREAGMITFDGKVVHGSTFFRYLGSIIQKDGELDGDVAHRIKAGWLKWKSATGILCDPGMPHRLKGKFYRTAIRPALLYGTECWAVKQCHVQKMNVAEMRMLRWMCGHTKKDRLRNEVIREKVRVASTEDKMMENRLRWFGHVRRRPVDAPVRRLESWGTSNIVKGRGRPKKTWIKLIENDMRFLGIGESAGANADARNSEDQVVGANVAKECLLAAAKSDPKAAHIWTNLANAYHLVGDHGTSGKCLEKAGKLDPNCLATRYAVGVHRIRDAERSQNPSEQLAWAGNEMASVLREGDSTLIEPPIAWAGLAMAHKAQHEIAAVFEMDPKELLEVKERAMYSLKQAIGEDPDDAVQWHQIGLHCLCTQQLKMSQTYFMSAVARLNDCVYTWSNLGISLQLLEESSQAEQVYKHALSLATSQQAHAIFSNLGNFYRQMRKFESAKAMFSKALDLHPGYAPAYNNLGLVFVAEGCFEEAKFCFNKANESDPLLDAAKSNIIKVATMCEEGTSPCRMFD